MDTKKRIQEIAKEYNLELIATTTANNGYPQEIKRALIGFTSYEQAEMVAERYGKELGLVFDCFTKCDGWTFWSRDKKPALPYTPYDMVAEVDRMGFDVIEKMDKHQFQEEEGHYENWQETYDWVKSMKDDEVLIFDRNNDQVVAVVKRYAMDFTDYDTHHYAIGLLCDEEYDMELDRGHYRLTTI